MTKSKRKRPGATETDSHRFGAHMSIAGGMRHALEAAHALRCKTVQVFVKNQRQWKATPFDDDDLAQWHALLDRPDFGPAVAHATYLINLASPEPDLHTKSRDAFTVELQRCDTLAIPYLVVHPGSAKGEDPDAGLRRVADALNEIYAANPDLQATVLLESTAGQGATLGRTPQELATIIDHVKEDRRVGVCFDTCHLFAAGYDIRDAEIYTDLMDECDTAFGLDRVKCWHFNDSQGACGSNRDRHAHIGQGEIGTAGFKNVLADPRFRGLPMILETPKGEDDQGRDLDAQNLRRLRTLSSRTT